MDAKICDRCGKVYGNSNTTIIVPADKYPNVGSISYARTDSNIVDLCEKCADELAVWFGVKE